MLQSVDVGEFSLDAYDGIVPNPTLDELRRSVEGLRGGASCTSTPPPTVLRRPY